MVTTLPRATGPAPGGIEVSFPSPGTARLSVAGELDMATAPMLGMRLLAVLADHRPAIIDVDLAEVTFLDCTGIGVLVAARNAAEQTGSRVWLSHPQPMPAVVLGVVGLLDAFTAPVLPSAYDAGSRNAVMLPPTRTRLARMARAMVGRKIAA
jgi:anti-anti-sigma factor